MQPTTNLIPPFRKSKIVAFVNDNLLIMSAYAAQIEDEGYTALIMLGGQNALSALALIRPPDLLLCDYSMPEMTGIQFLERLKEEQPGLYYGCRIVGFSSHSSESFVAKQFTSLGLEYVEKAHFKEQLIEIVDNHLNRRHQKMMAG